MLHIVAAGNAMDTSSRLPAPRNKIELHQQLCYYQNECHKIVRRTRFVLHTQSNGSYYIPPKFVNDVRVMAVNTSRIVKMALNSRDPFLRRTAKDMMPLISEVMLVVGLPQPGENGYKLRSKV